LTCVLKIVLLLKWSKPRVIGFIKYIWWVRASKNVGFYRIYVHKKEWKIIEKFELQFDSCI
jgi:hypothetical protein